VGPSGLSVTVTGDEAVVTLAGEHEAYTADKLERILTGLIDESVSVLVDLGRAAFIDSTVVGVLLAASRRARGGGVAFRLRMGAETGWPVRRLLEVTGLESQFEVVSTI
jgi:anti-sigma B factor antagonist